jgi:hypothetical protein
MVTVEELAKHTNAECPPIVSAVLKALRGEDETAATIEQLRAHVAGCPACAKRLSRLGRLIQALTGEAPERAPAAEPSAEVAPPAPNPASRRQHRRLPTNEAVNLVFEDGSVTLARMIEVSAKGARIESPDALEVDQNFTLNRGRRSTHVAVRHCSRQGELYIVGVEYMRQPVSV